MTQVPGAAQADAHTEPDWARPSARSLLVSPLKHLQDSLPAMLPLVVLAFSQGGHARWLLAAALVMPVGVALTGWYFTGYRLVGDQFQVRRGALHKQRSTVQVERIRTVNAQATALRRLLRVTDLEVSTGADSPLTLRGIDAHAAAGLQRTLLDRSARSRAAAAEGSPGLRATGTRPAVTDSPDTGSPDTGPPDPGSPVIGVRDAGPAGAGAPGAGLPRVADVSPSTVELARFDPAWLRLAPFTLSGVATAAAAAGLVFNVADDIDVVDRLGDWARDAWQGRPEQPLVLMVAESVLAALLTLALLSVVAYALGNWGYRLTRHGEGTLHVVRGLLTSRATTIEESRLRGAVLERPLLLSAAGGARARALLTGAGEGKGTTQTSDVLTPPAPVAVVERAIEDVLRDRGPLRVELVGHGVAAARRRWSRAMLGALPLVAVLAVAAWYARWPGWAWPLTVLPLPAAAALAAVRCRRLGHALTADYLVAAEGVLPHRRSMLRAPAVIGWVIEESWFQRRRGLVTLAATVAASGGKVRVLDVPRDEALAVVQATTPGLLEHFQA